MASQDIARLIVLLEARTKAFENALNRANGVANRRARSIEGRFAQMNKRIGTTMTGIGRGWLAGIVAGIGVRELAQLSDAATKIDNALKIAGLSGDELERVYGRLRDSAVKNAAPLEALVELYGRAALVQKELGVTSEELVGFTDKVALALRVSGKTAQESSGALLQLSQALGGGVVRAEEFNSILEGAPTIAQAAAAGLKEAGGSVAALRKLVIDGKISSEAFFRAFEAGAPILEQKVAGATYTINQAMGNLRTALIDAAREFNNSTGAAGRFADGINNVAEAISDFDVSGFIKKIQEAGGALDSWLDTIANADIFKRLGELATGQELTAGQPIGLDTVQAETDIKALEHQIDVLKQRIEANKEMAIDTTEAEAALATLLAQANALRAAIAGAGSMSGQNYAPGTPGDPNALAQQAGGLSPPAVVTPVSINDFKPPPARGGGRRKRENDYQREVQQIQERTAALQAETAAQAALNPLIDDYGYAVEYAAAKQELLNAAKEAGLAITPELAAKIDQLAAAYATASADAEKLAESQDKIREKAEEFNDFSKDVLGGFIRDLRDGKSASEALSNALSKVADKLLEIALNSIFDSGGIFGGGGFFSLLRSIFPFAEGGIAAHGRPHGPPLKRYARGGVSNSAAIFGEAGPEAAVPLPDGRRIPVDLRMPRVDKAPLGAREQIDIRLTDDSGRMAEIADQRIQTRGGAIVRVAVEQSQKATRKNFSGMLAESQMREF